MSADPSTELVAAMAGQLTAILRRYEAHLRKRRQEAVRLIIRYGNAAPLAPPPPRLVAALKELELDPIRFALKASAREIGWRAFAHGGLPLMRRVFNHAKFSDRSDGTLDHWWSGIGGPDHSSLWES